MHYKDKIFLVSAATITDDDAEVSVTLAVDTATIAEAAAVARFTATLSAVSGKDVTVDLGYSGTALLTDDYTRTGVQIVITAGNTTGFVDVTGPVNPFSRAIKNPLNQCQSGFEICHALAVFLERPQAENQIGA